MEISSTKTVNRQAKTLEIYCKVSDMFTGHIFDENGEEIGGQEDGYVPDFMPGEHFGDYLILTIELDTGLITNWTTPKPEDIESFISDKNP